MFELTLSQYKTQLYKELKAEYPDMSKGDFEYMYPQAQLFVSWLLLIKQDKHPSAKVLNLFWAIEKNKSMFWSFIRQNDIVLPDGWLNPDAVVWNEQNKTGIRRPKPKYADTKD